MSPPAGEAHHPLLIGGDELRRRLAGGRVRLLHAGGPQQFREAHIPGSVTADPPVQAAAGTPGDHTVVVYGALPADPVARALATELSARCTVRLLDGGLAAWAQAGGAVEGRRVAN